jgi:spermidine synthase
VFWFGVIVAALYALRPSSSLAVPAFLIVAVLIGLQWHDTHAFGSTVEWSPYYKVVTHPVIPHGRLDQGFITDVNGQFLLSGLDLRPNATLPSTVSRQERADVQSLMSYYSFPFSIADSPRVLILGAGAGNDVAAALRHGARKVVAVEIDPLVEQLGVDHHPEHPYQSPNVHVVINDGRAFLDHDHEKFDVVMYATLDAHGLLSAASNVRLDSFIYTRESLLQAKKHLAPDGLLVLSFGPFREDIQYRQYEMVRSVFGQEPLYFEHSNGHRTIIAGDIARVDASREAADWRQIGPAEISDKLRRYPYATIAATDDWPQLYLRSRGIPVEYAYVLAGMIGVGLLLVGRSFRGGRALQPHFLFLGAGFLLLETKSITEYALLFGSTWQTNSFVFIVILAVILFANLIILRSPNFVRLPVVYSLLIWSLIASFVWPIRSWVPSPGIARDVAAAAYLGMPLFLAALIFANTFKSTRLGSAALASNLIGAVVGGVAEYASLATGIRALSLLAVIMYMGSLFRLRARAASGSVASR